MDNVELTIKLTVAQVNIILASLAKGSYADVAEVIGVLHGQAKPQVDAALAQANALENAEQTKE